MKDHGADAKRKLYEMHAGMCGVFTNPKRLEVLNLLRAGERSVGALMGLSGLRQANLSQHLSVLRQKGVVEARREGSSVHYRLSDRRIIRAFDIIREMLFEKLRKEKNVLNELEEERNDAREKKPADRAKRRAL